MRVVFFGTYDDQRSPRVRILREGFAAHGHTVDECIVPLGFSSEMRVLMLRRPWLIPFMAVKLAWAWARLFARSARHRRPDVVVVGYMGHLDVHLARWRYRRAPIVLDHLVSLAGTAADRRVRAGLYARGLATADAAALRAADLVVVDTDEHVGQLPADARARSVVVPVGAQEYTFECPATTAPPPPLRVVFYGHFIPLQGTPIIGEAIALLDRRGRSDIRLTMIGRGQDLAEARRRAGDARAVSWIDRILDRRELTELVRRHHVGLGIFGTTHKAMNVVPTKVYEAAATGLAVVTADTPPQRRVLGDAAVYVAPGDPEALAAALEAFADHPARVAQLAADARALADRHFRPGAVVQPLLDQLPVVRRRRFPAPALSLNAWHRWDVVGPLLERLAPTSVLEVGTGRGAAAARLAARARYVGVEPDPTSAAAARAGLTAAGVRDAIVVDDLARVDGRGTFDLVCAFEVLEHVPDDSGSLACWSEYLRPGGHVLVSVPAHRHRYGPSDERVGHLRRYDRGDLDKLFADAGVSLERVWSVGWPVAYALEAAWDVVARVRPARGSSAERSAASGRLLQPPRFLGPAWRAASWPGRLLQRRTFDTDAGVGWVAFGRRL